MEFVLTTTLREAAARAVDGHAACEIEMFRQYASTGTDTIPLSDVRALSHVLRDLPSTDSQCRPAVWVHELLQGAAPVLPVFKPERKRDPALVKRLEKIRAVQENREYAAMVGQLSSGESTGRDEAEMSTYRSQMGVGLNLLVSMGTMFCVGYFIGGCDENPHCVRAAICGLGLMIVAIAIEMLLFLIGASRVDAKMHKREQHANRKGVNDLTQIREHYPNEVNAGSRRRR